MRLIACLVVVRAQMRHDLRFVECGREIQIGGRVVDRIRVQDDQPIHFARIEIGHQLLKIA